MIKEMIHTHPEYCAGYQNGKIDASKFSNLDDAINGFEIDRPDNDYQKGYLLALLHLKRGV